MSKPPMNAVKSTGISGVDDKSNMKEDLTGRDRMVWNVLTSWAGHMVFVIAGFIMPRMIDRHIGQTSLGIWDFSWSLVNYFGLAGLGIGSSVNRYVAKYRAVNDIEGLRKAVSSVCVDFTGFASTGSTSLPCFAVLEGGYSRDFAECLDAFVTGWERR